jgi:hypothetical protein
MADPAMAARAASDHSLDSSLRERVIEHLFVGDLLRTLWRAGRRDVEVLRAEVDMGGYDLAIESGGSLRHIQLKASHRGARTARVAVSVKLAAKPSGCVVWVMFDADTLALGPFLWLGSEAGGALPDLGARVARHSKADSRGVKGERPGHRIVRRGAFARMETIGEVAAALFGG